MRVLLAFLPITVAAFWLYGTIVDSPFVGSYVSVTLVLIVVVGLIHRFARFPLGVLWGLAAVAMGNLAGGVLLVDGQPLYSFPLVGDLRYDKPFHTVATGVAAWACCQAVHRWSGHTMPRAGVAFAAVLMASGAGALVEIVEYVASRLYENTNVGDYGDNMLDLVANLAGAGAAVAGWWTLMRRRAVSAAG